jgi:PBSX family phage terminase large subunit
LTIFKEGISLKDLIAPPFYEVHRAIKEHSFTHYDLMGGRGSTKSSFASIEIILILLRNSEAHAVVLRKVAATLRDSVFAQYIWAISRLKLERYFICKVSPMELIFKPTGQKILFRGLDGHGEA